MDWDTYYPGGQSPLDDVQVEAHTEHVGSGLLFNYVEDDPPLVERSTIERILTSLNRGEDALEVLTTTDSSSAANTQV